MPENVQNVLVGHASLKYILLVSQHSEHVPAQYPCILAALFHVMLNLSHASLEPGASKQTKCATQTCKELKQAAMASRKKSNPKPQKING